MNILNLFHKTAEVKIQQKKSPSPSKTSPLPDPAKVRELGLAIYNIAQERGDNVEEIMLQALTSYEDGSLFGQSKKVVDPETPSAAPIPSMDSFAQTCDVLTTAFDSMDKLRTSLAETLGAGSDNTEPVDEMSLQDIIQLYQSIPKPKTPTTTTEFNPAPAPGLIFPNNGGGDNGQT